MAYILTSEIGIARKDKSGNYVPVALDNTNSILTNIKKYLPKRDNLLVIANNQDNYERNDAVMLSYKKSFELTGIPFKNYYVLDARNKSQTKELVLKADFIHICGGETIPAKKFYDEINLKEIIKTNNRALVLGLSSGAMFLGEDIFNFPESPEEIELPKEIKGFGIADIIYIPHFDGENKKYQLDCPEIDVVNDWVLPYSHKQKMHGFPNGSYAVLDNAGKLEFFGPVYEIYKGKVSPISQKLLN